MIRVRDNGSVFTNGTYRGGVLAEDGTFTNLGSLIIGTGGATAVKGGEITVYGDFKTDEHGTFYHAGTLKIMAGSAVIDGGFEAYGLEENQPAIEIAEGAAFSATDGAPEEPGIYQYINDSWEKR